VPDEIGAPWRTPVPDPTLLTTEALVREVGHLRELLTARLDGLEDRLDSYQEAHAEKHRSRASEVEKEVQHLTELVAERFAGIQAQLLERESRYEESNRSSKEAVSTALAAQKEAAAKAEVATKEQLASLKSETGTVVTSLEGRITNVKELLTTARGRDAGLETALSRTFTIVSIVVAVVAVAAAVIVGTRG